MRVGAGDNGALDGATDGDMSSIGKLFVDIRYFVTGSGERDRGEEGEV